MATTITKVTRKHVTLTGLTDILFDRYPGSNKTVLSDPAQKFYLDADRHICLPTMNILSFLTAQNTESAPKVCLDKRLYKSICSALLCSVTVTPNPLIPFLREGQPITYGVFDDNGFDATSGARVLHHVARLEKGIPNPKERPSLPTPWTLTFDMQILPHPDLTEQMVENLFVDGGMRLGLGTFRKMFGKFSFAWE